MASIVRKSGIKAHQLINREFSGLTFSPHRAPRKRHCSLAQPDSEKLAKRADGPDMGEIDGKWLDTSHEQNDCRQEND